MLEQLWFFSPPARPSWRPPPPFKRGFSPGSSGGLLPLPQGASRARGDGCTGVQLGKIMNEVDCGWQRPSLKRNGSQQRVGILTRPSPTPPSCRTSLSTQQRRHSRPPSTLIKQRFALAHARRVPKAPDAWFSIRCVSILEACLGAPDTVKPSRALSHTRPVHFMGVSGARGQRRRVSPRQLAV